MAEATASRLLAPFTIRDGFNEQFDANGSVRSHWRALLSGLDTLGEVELQRRWAVSQELIQEHAVTYNLFRDPSSAERLLKLDPLPVILPREEWAAIERGLTQRMALLNLILADIYGPQRLVRSGILPPALVFGNPNFLRPCHGLNAREGFLHLVGCDLFRDPSGVWTAVNNRTNIPFGLGYTLENRIILSRTLPELFAEHQIRRLAGFFDQLQKNLGRLAPRGGDNPHIVMLTPGPSSDAYFEHAYVARYLGMPLVESGDLTVRGQTVYLKTLSGLQQVDVIFRRLDDQVCDPLALRSNAPQGVPGLIDAIHAGKVAVSNLPGSACVEVPVLLPFLPALCRYFLDEDLLLPSIQTWWCGDPGNLSHVEANFDRLLIKPAYVIPGKRTFLPSAMTPAQRIETIGRLRAHPQAFVAQEKIAFSSVAVYEPEAVQPKKMLLRAFITGLGQEYKVLPGGLTRISNLGEALSFSTGQGGGCKDTWIPGNPNAASEATSLLHRSDTLAISRGSDLPSRVADNLFWMGRYVERTESQLRLLRGVLSRLGDEPQLAAIPELPAVLEIIAGFGLLTRLPGGSLPKPDDLRKTMERALFAQDRVSLSTTLSNVHRIASLVRDRLSMDTWRVLRRMEKAFRKVKTSDMKFQEEIEILNDTLLTLSAFSGLAMESMTRGIGWSFLDMGRRLERVHYLSGLVQGTIKPSSEEVEAALLRLLLEVADSLMTFRSRYRAVITMPPFIDLILLDENNPRSVSFQLVQIEKHVKKLPRGEGREQYSPAEKITLRLLTDLRLTDAAELCAADSTGTFADVDRLVRRLTGDMPRLSDLITQKYLSHIETPRQLSGDLPATGPQ